MLKKCVQERMSVESKRNAFDFSNLGDPIAIQTDWSPIKHGGTNIRTHRLAKVNSNRLKFRASLGAKVFYISFLITGIGVMIGFPYFTQASDGFSFDTNTIMPLLIAISFIIAGSCLFYFGITPIVFDKQNGFFWKGYD